MIEQTVKIDDQTTLLINEQSPVVRYSGNPLLTATDVNKVWQDPSRQVVTVHNAGVVRCGHETIMLFRSHLRSGVSIIGIARSKNGIHDWKVDPAPALVPATERDLFADGADPEELIENESGGVEDPRIIDMGSEYAITYSAYHAVVKNRVRVSLATTRDFKTFTRFGPILDRDMRNVVFFPKKIGGRYVALFRPNDQLEGDVGGIFTQIRIGYSSDWHSNAWEIETEPIMRTGTGPSAFSDKIGPGAPPLQADQGWLDIFHGVRTTMDGNPYVLGIALHKLSDPAKLQICSLPILFPTAADCRVEEDAYIHVPNVVFSCGAILNPNGSIYIYYGGNDTVMNLGISHQDVLAALCEKYPLDPMTGRPL